MSRVCERTLHHLRRDVRHTRASQNNENRLILSRRTAVQRGPFAILLVRLLSRYVTKISYDRTRFGSWMVRKAGGRLSAAEEKPHIQKNTDGNDGQ